MAMKELGLDAAFIGRLDQLALVARQRTQGAGAGPRRSLATGSSVEFADFRTYAPGDDFRRVDWNAFARLERLFLRIFEAEENATLTLFVDCSTSMGTATPTGASGTGDQALRTKALLARQIAASLAYVALTSYDRVAVAGLRDTLAPYLPPRSGRGSAPEIWRFIAGLPEEGRTALECLGTFERYSRRPGLAIVLSDLLSESDWRAGLRALQTVCRQEVTLLQVLAPEEIDPNLDGDWTLVDRETQARVEISAGPAVLNRYLQALAAYTAEIGAWCRTQNVAYLQVSSATSVDDLVLRLLRRVGVLR